LNSEFRSKVIAKVAQLGLGLEHKVDQPIGTLSGGQRQALTLLMTVMDQTDVLLMDEPSSALDPSTAKTVMGLAAQITRDHGLTTLLVTHNLKDAEKFGDRIIMLENGSVKKDIQGEGKRALSSAEIFSWF
jgi:putative ABC transport system ATP-binding protein